VSYDFLALSLLFLVPGALVWTLRPDLRRVIRRMAVMAIPFAFTESWFYPEYWEPRFLFDLADRIGFGIEDLLFVVGLAAFTSTAYAAVTGTRYVSDGDRQRTEIVRRVAMILGATFLLVGAAVLLDVPMIYAAPPIMLAVAAVLVGLRRDLLVVGAVGALVSTLVYGVLCWLFLVLFPDAFASTWHTEQFLNIFVLGLPLEEILYALGAGAAASVVYPFVFGERLVRIRDRDD
jgi:hypothetical protein